MRKWHVLKYGREAIFYSFDYANIVFIVFKSNPLQRVGLIFFFSLQSKDNS